MNCSDCLDESEDELLLSAMRLSPVIESSFDLLLLLLPFWVPFPLSRSLAILFVLFFVQWEASVVGRRRRAGCAEVTCQDVSSKGIKEEVKVA